jgi:hypothetical protein
MTDDVAATLRALEELLLDPAVRRSREKLETLLGDEFVEYGASGAIYNKEQVVSALEREHRDSAVRREACDFRISELADGIAQVTYKATRIDEASVETRSLRSSIWKFKGGRWQMVFHQGTPVAQGPK